MAIDTGELTPTAPPPAPMVGDDGGEGTAAPTAEAAAAVAEERPASLRLALAVALPVVAAAVMVGGVFKGVAPRPSAAIAGLLGVALGTALARSRRNAVVSNLLVVFGLFGIGLVMVVPSGFGNLGHLQALVSDSVARASTQRPPVDFTAGWRAISGWLLGIVGFAAAWVALTLRRPSLGLLLPLPVAAIAGISVPKDAQIVSGLVVLVLFAIGLGLLSSEQSTGDGDDRPSAAFEVRKAVKALPLLAVLVGVLYFLATNASFLFPKPVIDPAQQPQKPKTVPLTKVPDRVLFTVESQLSGPWRIGSLDVYDGRDWRLPPFADNKLKKVPTSGIVDPDLAQGERAVFTVAGLGGAVLPGLPNTVGVAASGPALSYDGRNGSIRLTNGQVTPGLRYTVAASSLPTIEDLRTITDPLPPSVKQFTDIPPMPPAVSDLIGQAKTQAKPDAWDQFDFLRTFILDNVIATGPGSPIGITPERVADMVAGSKKGSPFEIVAAQAMLARWVGVPSRIGYGFDGGELVNNKLEVRPANGATFVEVYFPGKKWLPVVGTPKKAEPTVGGNPGQQKVDPNVQPSDDIAVQLFVPTVVPPASVAGKQIAVLVLLALLALVGLALLYTAYPAVRKGRLRARRRRAALAAGPRARVALAYAEWRDHATDYGFAYPTDTPLMFLDRFFEDPEHTELAWLTTRVLWGDLRDSADPQLAPVAEELSRSMRRRLSSAQPSTVRFVSRLSRLSLRTPYAPQSDERRSRRRRGRRVSAPTAGPSVPEGGDQRVDATV